MSAPFGTPGSIDPQRLHSLPAAMRREGVLMLLDMDLSRTAASNRLGMTGSAFDQIVRDAPAPFRRGGEQTFVEGQ